MRALIVREPYVSAILRGEKTWEMRSRNCAIRGQIGLIRKGSGHVVGVVDLVDCRPAIATYEAYAATEAKHRVPPAAQAGAFADGWRIPWVLANARALDRPVPYQHKSGAVTWVALEPAVIAAIESQIT